jgi:hypothetical protein
MRRALAGRVDHVIAGETLQIPALLAVAHRYEGTPRFRYRAAPEGSVPDPDLKPELASLYGGRADLEQVRLAGCRKSRFGYAA